MLHLVAADIYTDIRFLSWTSGGDGGGFSDERSTAPVVPAPAARQVPLPFDTISAIFVGVVLTAMLGRRREG